MEEIVSGKKEEPSADDDEPDPAEWVKTSYTYDVTAPYYEVLTETTNGVTTSYDYGVERLSAYVGTSAWNTIKTQYIYDGRGSVAQELINNNSWYTFGGALSKTTKASYSYTPSGELLSGSTAKTTFYAYNGESYDSATGMVNLRARWYEPAMMRFSQRDSWSGKLEMPTTENRYLYCINDPIGYYDRGGDRADEGSGVPQKVTTSTNAKKTAATPKTPTPAPKTTPLPRPAPSPDTKFNANTTAKKSSNTFTKILIGAVTVAVCIGIIAVSGGFATPVAAMTFSTLFASTVATSTVLRFGNNLIQQIDQTKSFEEASNNAGKQTTRETPSILALSLFTAGLGSLAGGTNTGALPPLGLKNIPFATSAFDDAIDDASGAYAGTQANGATQSGSAGTTACTQGQAADDAATGAGNGSYQAPTGGGGVSNTIRVGDNTITFGHGARHVSGIDVSTIEESIAKEVPNLVKGEGYTGYIIIHGVKYEYRAFGLGEGVTHVGTYFPSR